MEKHRLISVSLFILSVLAIYAGYFLLQHPSLLDYNIIYGIAQPLYLSIRWLPFLFLILVFVSPKVFFFWVRIILPLALIALFLIVTAPITSSFYPDRVLMTEWMTYTLVVVSLVLIVAKYIWLFWKKKELNKATND